MSASPRCTHAIIAVAGFGTRRLPITKAIEKCMLPIGNRPIVDYVVEDCIKAGITDITFVVGEQAAQIRTYYGDNEQLETYLAQQGKTAALQEIQGIAQKATYRFVVQDRAQPYGTSVPLWLAKAQLEPEEPFLFLYGDNIFYNQDGSSAVAEFLGHAERAGAKNAMLAKEVPHKLVSRYGIVATSRRGDVDFYQKIVEKPKPEAAPSNRINAGCFLLTPDIMPYVARSLEHSPQEERYVIDAINWYVEAGNDMAVITTSSDYLDCGAADGWLLANNRLLAIP